MKYLITLVIISIVWMLMSSYLPSSSTKGGLAPGFTVTLFEGDELRLKDLRGEVVLLNFWASWCPPCRNEATDLEAAWRENKDKGIYFLGINIPKDKAQDAHRFLKNFGITYSNGWDDGSISRKYSAWGIPKTYIIGPKGRITYIHTGAIRYATIADKLGEARRGLITTKEGKGLYQSTKDVTIDELAQLLESTRKIEKKLLQKPLGKDRYRRINVQAVKTHKGRWVKILLKDGSERDGKIVAVKKEVIQLEEILNAGSFSIHVPIQQIEEVHLLIPDSRANIGQ